MMDFVLTELPRYAEQYGELIAVVLLILLIASGFGLPMPEDIPLLASGLLCYLGKVPLVVMIPATFVAVLGADCLIYGLGRRFGDRVPRLPVLRTFLSPDRLAAAQGSFHKHGGKTLFVARFLPGLRAPIFFSAGLFKLPFWKMLVFDGGAALISVPTLVLVAYFFGGQIENVKHWTDNAQRTVLVLIVIAIVGFVGYKFARRKKPNGDGGTAADKSAG